MSSFDRLFEYLSENSLNFPVLHHITFLKGIPRDDLVIKAGANAGALLVDGLGDCILLEALDQDCNHGWLHSKWTRGDGRCRFGYVGGAPGKIDLYVGKTVVQRGIAMENATNALIQLIKR
ncbi:putative (E)-4-hydroxy-3-methylbut-2-enyl-diphosphate synthase (ferredoxin) [Helianthus anomalus]